jgi:hypothetical protein
MWYLFHCAHDVIDPKLQHVMSSVDTEEKKRLRLYAVEPMSSAMTLRCSVASAQEPPVGRGTTGAVRI